jgi:putative holliday junction resolvase
MSKILTLDFGLKRTGIAISDESKTFAFGLKTVDSKTLDNELNALVSSEKIDTIVIGEPKRLDNTATHITQNVYLLKEHLEKKFAGIKIILHDERFSSKMAQKSMIDSGISKKKRSSKELVDEVSATIILQSYLSFIS